MTTVIAPGRWLGLRNTSTDKHVFTILAFDQRGSYKRMLPDGTTYEEAVNLKQAVIDALTPHTSAVLLDPTYGLMPAQERARGCGLLMSLEKSGYTGDSTYRGLGFDKDWTVAKIAQMGGTAVKLMVYYHPDTGELATDNEATIQAVADECHQYGLPLFLEPMSYSLDADISKNSAEFAATRPEVIIETARRLSRVGADVLKLEFPHDAKFNSDHNAWAEACQAVSEVCAIPWVLLSAGVDFEIFEQQVIVACEAGASGWLAGRAMWKESVDYQGEERAQFLNEKAVSRVRRLVELANEKARPWTDFYSPLTGDGDWYRSA